MAEYITRVCREGACASCTGCPHSCHAVPPPADFRELVDAARPTQDDTEEEA